MNTVEAASASINIVELAGRAAMDIAAENRAIEKQDIFNEIKQTTNLPQEKLVEMLVIANMFTLTKRLTDSQGIVISKKESTATYQNLITHNWPYIYQEDANELLKIGMKGMETEAVKTEFNWKFNNIQTREKARIKKSHLVKK